MVNKSKGRFVIHVSDYSLSNDKITMYCIASTLGEYGIANGHVVEYESIPQEERGVFVKKQQLKAVQALVDHMRLELQEEDCTDINQ